MSPDQITSTGSATYCPEDNKLRLYVGRVPRAEFELLRAEGWTCTPKQECNFVAHWTPERRDTALAYGDGFIGDEDQSPAERAAERAERFGGYRDKRTDEANGHADRYEAGPMAHGFQNQARAERAAARHDRIADRAGDAWSKAEYWTQRTAGVISHALHVSAPYVRMGRIKELEAAIRKAEKDRSDYEAQRQRWIACAAMTDYAEQTKRAGTLAGMERSWSEYAHPRTGVMASLWTHMEHERTDDKITGAEACALYLAKHGDLSPEGEWLTHYRLRLAYEEQMLEAQGGRAGVVEMERGGTWKGGVIAKINKSNATSRVVSVSVVVPHVEGWAYRITNEPGTPFALMQCETERADPGAYNPPTDESRAKLEAFYAAKKATMIQRKATVPACPLINPTDEDAERLQAIWNARIVAKGEERKAKNGYAYCPELEGEPSKVLRITQATYSANTGGAYSKAETVGIMAGGAMPSGYEWRSKTAVNLVAKVRVTFGENYKARRVVILTDKPQKPFPASLWQAATVEAAQPVNA